MIIRGPSVQTDVRTHVRTCSVSALCEFALNSGMLQVDIRVNGHTVEMYTADSVVGTQSSASEAPVMGGKREEEEVCGGTRTRPLSELAFIRSGDKGDTANIGMQTHMSMHFEGNVL